MERTIYVADGELTLYPLSDDDRQNYFTLDIRHLAREEETRLNACQAAKVFYKLQQIERARLKAKEEISRLTEFANALEKAMNGADEYAYPPYKLRCVENMYEYIGI